MTGKEFKAKYQTKIDLLKSVGIKPWGFDPGIKVVFAGHTINLPDPFVELLCSLISKANSQPDLLEACKAVIGLIGNVDHSKGNGANSAKMRGVLLNDLRSIAKIAIAKATE